MLLSFFEGLLKPRFDPEIIIHQNFIPMKKYLLLFVSLLMTVILLGQSNGKRRNDVWIYKPSPGLLLDGSGAFINFNNGDLLLTQSTNTLTLSGGNLALGTNSLTLTGSIGATGSRITKGWFTNLEITNLPTVGGASLSALYTSGNISIGTNSLLLTGSIAATGNRVTKGWFADIESTNAPTISGVSMAQIMTISKTIGGVGVAACDFNFATATNTSEQVIDLGAIVPAKARILDVVTFTNSVFTGATTLVAETGVTSSGAELVASATIYAANAITSLTHALGFNTAPSASAAHIYVAATPGANWSLVTAGKVTVSVTYIAY
jgi:hypothetical protein